MADKEKTYVAIWVLPKVRKAIKDEATKNGRTIIGELSIKYKVHGSNPKGTSLTISNSD